MFREEKAGDFGVREVKKQRGVGESSDFKKESDRMFIVGRRWEGYFWGGYLLFLYNKIIAVAILKLEAQREF